MSKNKTKREKLYFMKSPQGYGYHAGQVEEVPSELAKDFKRAGFARPATETLPTDLPGRDAFMKYGIETVEEVKSLNDPLSVDGITSKTIEDLALYFGEVDDGSELPEDLPGREALIEAGVKSVEEIAEMEDPQEVDGIGPKTAKDLAAYLAENE